MSSTVFLRTCVYVCARHPGCDFTLRTSMSFYMFMYIRVRVCIMYTYTCTCICVHVCLSLFNTPLESLMQILSSRLLSCVVTHTIPLPKPFRPCLTKGGHWVTSRTSIIVSSAVCARNMSGLEDLTFDNRVLKSLPIDTDTDNYVRSVAGIHVVPHVHVVNSIQV